MRLTILRPRTLVRAFGVAAAIVMTAVTAAAQPVSVTGANPPTGEQDTVSLIVRVTGRNFAPGARADFFKSKTSNPAGITVRETRYVSATELDAVIDIAATAELSYFDVRVTNLSGRSGKGSDLFQVVQKGGAAAVCSLESNPPNFVQIATLNPGIGGGTYSTELGLGMKAVAVNVGASQAVMVAVGRTGGVEVFFLDPTKVPSVESTPAAGFIDFMNPHASINLTGATWVREMAVGDVDADGTPDILASDRGKAWLLKGSRNDSNQVVFEAPGVHAIAVPSTVPVSNFFGWGVALGDLDGGPGDEIVISQTPFQSGKKSHSGKIHLYGWLDGAVVFRHTVLPSVSPALAQADGYGRSVTVGDFTGGTLNDVVAGAPGRGPGGTLWIFPDPWNATAVASVATIVPVAIAASSNGHPVGWKVQAADVNGDGGIDLATTSAWGSSSDSGVDVRGETFLDGTTAAASLTFQPVPGLHMGWSTMGIDIGNLFEGPEPEVVVGAPNATTSSSCDNVGRLYVFPGRATPGAPWEPYELRPPTLDVDYGGYGWSAAFVDGLNLLLVAEKGRTVNGVANAGQVYVYRVD